MNIVFLAPYLLALLLIFILGFVSGQSIDLGWGLPLGTSLTCLIAGLALLTTIGEFHAARKHNQLQVRPHLIFDSCYDSVTKEGYQTYRLTIKNVGLGPAVIDRLLITLDENDCSNSDSIFTEWIKLINNNTPAKGRAVCGAGFLDREEALDKGEKKMLLEFSMPTDKRSFMQGREIVKELVNKIDASINYKCHYGNDFEATNKKNFF